jgi:hypothetical protein
MDIRRSNLKHAQEERRHILADFTTINTQYNTNTDASPTWTSTALAFGGSAGANEIRWCNTSAGGASTASASWPIFSRPGSGTAAVGEAWAFTADTTGLKIALYDGSKTSSNVLRWNWDNTGTFAAAPQFSAFGDNTHATPSAGTQPGAQSGSPIVNGQTTDTSSTSYLKINAYGNGSSQAPAAGAAGTTLAVTSGTAGAVSPGSAAWLSTWQSAQGFIQYILCTATPAATTANTWVWTCALFTGVNMSTGTLQAVITFQYAFS